MNIKKPNALYFDWDGTLADSFAFLQTAHNHALAELKLPARDDGWFHFYYGKDRDFIYRDIYGDHDPEARVLFEKFVYAHHTDYIEKIAGACDLLKTCETLNIPCAIVTNKVGDFVRKEVTAFGWDHHFKTLVGAGEAEQDKPSAAPLKLAAQHTGITENIWYIGDSISDMKCADAYGCPFILVHPLHDDTPDFYDETLTHAVFSDLKSFNDNLLNLF